MSKVVQDETKYIDIRIGDYLPSGAVVTKAELTPDRHDATRSTIQLTVAQKGRLVTYAAEWSDETYGESVARAEFMQGLPN